MIKSQTELLTDVNKLKNYGTEKEIHVPIRVIDEDAVITRQIPRLSNNANFGFSPCRSGQGDLPLTALSSFAGRESPEKIPDITVKMQVYSKIFSDIISQDKNYGQFLGQIKTVYEFYIWSLEKEVSLKEAKLELNSHMELQKSKKQVEQLVGKISKLHQKSETERKQHQNDKKSLVEEVKCLKNKESKFRQLVNLLKLRGYPVKDLYEKHIRMHSSGDFSSQPKETSLMRRRISGGNLLPAERIPLSELPLNVKDNKL